MGTEVASTSSTTPIIDNDPKSIRRPFKLLVKQSTFTIDSNTLRDQSPIFAVMCYGRDFENGRELEREIVDENVDDISIFVQCLQSSPTTIHRLING
jgi:hypothetical protein